MQNDKDSKLEENKAALFDAFPDLKALAVSLRGVNSDASAGGTSEPFSVQGENDGVTYMTVDPTAPVNFVPGSAPYYPERKKIREKRKRRLPIFDVSKLKMKMAKAFLKLMKIDSDELGNEGPKKGK